MSMVQSVYVPSVSILIFGGGVNYMSFINTLCCHALVNIAMYTLFMNVAMDLYTSLYLGMDL